LGDVGEVEAEAVVHQGTGIMMIALQVAVVVVVTLITATVTGAGGLEVEAQEEDQVGAEAQRGRETGAQLGKAVLKEELRLNNGTEKKKQNRLLQQIKVTSTMINDQWLSSS